MFKKEGSKFLKLSKTISKSIDSGNLDEAIKHYDDLANKFDNLPEKKQLEYGILFFSIRDQLLIYRKIKETIDLLNSSNNIELIKDNISQLNSFSNNYGMRKKMLKYVKNNIEYINNYYSYKLSKIDFKEILDDIYHCIWEERYDDALKKFPNLMSKFKQMEKHSKNDELYESIMRLKSHINTSLLASQAYSKISKISKV